MSESELSIYVGTDEFLDELRELGYQSNIELDDLIDFLDEDPSYIEQMRPSFMAFDEIAFVSPILAEWQYNRRPT
jgi:hypothetical protein